MPSGGKGLRLMLVKIKILINRKFLDILILIEKFEYESKIDCCSYKI